MIYPVYVYGSPVLRQPARDVEATHPDLKTLVEDMYRTMSASSGVGLAAPQIGLPLRMFVVDLSSWAEDEPSYATFKRAFINPEIYWESDIEESLEEGCLSVPGLNEEVWRPEKIRVRWVDEDFVNHDEEFDGYRARVIQHEYDHLQGKMFVDRLPALKRTMLRNRLAAMSRGKYDASYKTKVGK